MTKDDLSRYSKSREKYGDSPKALRWADYRAAARRYSQLVNDVDFKDKTILDAGCGMGDLLPYIYAKVPVFSYHGVDMMEEFVSTAKTRYPGHNFEVGDPFAEDFKDKYDVVICSGVLNANHSDWMNERKERIKKLFFLANEALIFNMAGYHKPKDSKPAATSIAYAPVLEILEYCLSLTPKVILKNHYHNRDFTVVMFKSGDSQPEQMPK